MNFSATAIRAAHAIGGNCGDNVSRRFWIVKPVRPRSSEGTERRRIGYRGMTSSHEQDLDEHLERFERRLPKWAAAFVGWLRQPGSRWIRLPLGIVLILAGIVGFLPILGFWMVPLGLIVMAKDLPPLQPALVRILDWGERKWPAR
jgi:hypothetical protein